MFRCPYLRETKCVHYDKLCDGTDDCGDGSDEVSTSLLCLFYSPTLSSFVFFHPLRRCRLCARSAIERAMKLVKLCVTRGIISSLNSNFR